MDTTLIELMEREEPKINPLIGNGISTYHLPFADRYIHQVWMSISRNFPEGLVYAGRARCTPLEQYKEAAKKRQPKKSSRKTDSKMKKAPRGTFDLATSNIYMMKYKFRLHGVDIPDRYMYLPYATEGGVIQIAGSQFVISPVLSDVVISPQINNVFAVLLCAKLTFRRIPHDYIVNGRGKQMQVIWSMVYNRGPDMRNMQGAVKAETTLVHYLFCKYGVREAFKKFVKADVIFGNEEINRETYPADTWTICESVGFIKRTVSKRPFRKPALRVAVRNDQWSSHTESFIGGLFYLLDNFSLRMTLETLDSQRLWRVLLGHILWSENVNEGLLHDKVTDHITSIDRYMDLITQEKLQSIGYRIETIYDFFNLVLEKFDNWTLEDRDRISSMYGKELSVLYYVLEHITRSIVDTHFALQAAAKRASLDPKKALTAKSVGDTFNRHLKPGAIFGITRSQPGVSAVTVSGDNKAFKMTTILIPQTSSNKRGKRKEHTSAKDPAKFMHVSVAEIGGVFNIQKNEATGRTRQNVYGQVTNMRNVAQNPKYLELTQSVQDDIRR